MEGHESARMTIDIAGLVDAFPALVWTTLTDGSAEFLNQQWTTYTGVSLQEAQGWGWIPAIHPDDFPNLLEKYTALLQGDEPGEVEARMRRFDGEYRWFLFRANPLRDETGHIVRWCGTNIDIEDRKRAESQLAAENRLLEMIASGVPLHEALAAVCRFVEEIFPECLCAVYPIDWNGPIFRYGVAQSLPASFIDPIRGWSVAVDKSPCGVAVAGDRQVIVADVATDPIWHETEYCDHLVRHGLRSVWSTLIRSLDGRVLGSFCIYQAAPATPTPRHQQLIAHATRIASIALDRDQASEALTMSEEGLRRAHAQLAEAQGISKTGSFTSDLQANLHEWSDEFYRIFEIDPATPPGLQAARERVHPDDLALFDFQMQRSLDGGASDFVFRIVTPSSGLKHLRGVARLVEHSVGRRNFMGTVQDITERVLGEDALNRARAELAHVSRVTALSALSASIAHEVNQPLAGIVTNASTCLRLLAVDPPDTVGAKATAQRTIRDANRASEVIKRLRALFARRLPGTEPVDLNDAVRELLALCSGDLQAARVVLRTDLAEDLPIIVGDRVQLQQVILNLVLNATDAMRAVDDRHRALAISTIRDGDDDVRLSVRDAGQGATAEQLARFFDAFYTTKSEGMGVGLSISRSIVEAHGGRIWAESNVGAGLTLSFSIPVTFPVAEHEDDKLNYVGQGVVAGERSGGE